MDCLPRYVLRRITRKKGYNGRNIMRLSEPRERNLTCKGLPLGVIKRFGHIRVDKARCHAIDCN